MSPPILYQNHCKHFLLRETLRIWSEMFRDGIYGKEQVVFQLAEADPGTTTEQDNFVGRMLWALADPSGNPAKRFAENDPVPRIDWLEPLSVYRYRDTDLRLFGVAPLDDVDSESHFSFLRRPTPYRLAPTMELANPSSNGKLDNIMFQLARWLTRHLNDPKTDALGGRARGSFAQYVSSTYRGPNYSINQDDAGWRIL